MRPLLLCLLLSFPPLLSAQFDQNLEFNDLLEMSIEDLLQLEVTSSTLTPLDLKSVPAAVTVVTHAEIVRMGIDTLDELINLIPGYQFYRNAGASLEELISARGRRISVPSAEILLLVDGQRFLGGRSNGLAIPFARLSLAQIDKVEFIRGPGSSVYGSNAMMGIINIVTRRGVNEAEVSYGSFDRQRFDLFGSHTQGDLQLDLFTHIDGDDGQPFTIEEPFAGGDVDTRDPYLIKTLNLKLQWQKSKLSYYYHSTETHQFYHFNHIANEINMSETNFHSLFIEQGFSWLNVDSQLQLGYLQNDYDSRGQLAAAGALSAVSSPASDEPLYGRARYLDSQEYRLKWHNDYQIDSSLSFQFGTEYRHLRAPFTRVISNFDMGELVNASYPITYYGDMVENAELLADYRQDILGIYAQYQQQFISGTHLTFGARYDSASSIGERLSPRFAVVQELNVHQSIKLLYGEAFRLPSQVELNLKNNPVTLGNPDLKPEVVKTWDLIWMGQWQQQSFSVGYFESHFENAIVQQSQEGSYNRFENIDQDPVSGVELEMTWQPSQPWLLRSAYTHLFETPSLSYREAEKLFSMSVNYQFNRFNGNLIAMWRDTRHGGSDTQQFSLPPYWLVNMKLSYLLTPSVNLFGQVKNLLDEEYETPATEPTLTHGVPNRGSEWLMGLTWKF